MIVVVSHTQTTSLDLSLELKKAYEDCKQETPLHCLVYLHSLAGIGSKERLEKIKTLATTIVNYTQREVSYGTICPLIVFSASQRDLTEIQAHIGTTVRFHLSLRSAKEAYTTANMVMEHLIPPQKAAETAVTQESTK